MAADRRCHLTLRLVIRVVKIQLGKVKCERAVNGLEPERGSGLYGNLTYVCYDVMMSGSHPANGSPVPGRVPGGSQ